VKKAKSEPENAPGEVEGNKNGAHASDAVLDTVPQQANAPNTGLDLAPPLLPEASISTAPVAEPDPVSAPQLPSLTSGNQPCK
jgi:hypothetical protein